MQKIQNTQHIQNILYELDIELNQRKTSLQNNSEQEKSYVKQLYLQGLDKILKKINEEANEVSMASKDMQYHPTETNKQNIVHEIADLWFHTLVLLHYNDLNSSDVLTELKRRQGISGIEEKQQRNHD